GATAQIGDDVVTRQKREHRSASKAIAVEFATEPVPFACGAGEKGLAVSAAFLKTAGKTQFILPGRGPGVGLLARQEPEAPPGNIKLIQDHAIQVRRSTALVADPSLVAQDLQMPADRGLGHLQDIT